MALVAYHYGQDDNFPAFLAAHHIDLGRSYHDHLPRRPELHHCLEDCHSSPPEALLIPSIAAIATTLTAVHQNLETLWADQIPVLLIDTNRPAPIALMPSDWGIESIGTLGDLPAPQRMEPQDWIQLGAVLEQSKRKHHALVGHQATRLKEAPPPGKAPYGYRRGRQSYHLDRRAAPVVKGFYENFLLYGCLRQSVRFVAQTYGKKISVSTAKRWLTHPVYRGHLCYQGQHIIQNTHPALLSSLEAAQVDRLLKCNQRFAGKSASASRSLAGLVHCAQCKSPMTISQVTKPRSKKQYLYLRPQACPQVPKCSAISYDQVLAQTIEQICDRLPNAVQALPQQQQQKKQSVTQEITQKQDLLAQVTTLENSGVLDSESAQLRRFNLKTELATLQKSLADMPPVNLLEASQAIALPEFWQDLSETERRVYLREFIHTIQIHRQGKNWSVDLEFVFEKPWS